MASRKEEKERLRAERLAAEQADAGGTHRRLLIGYVVAGLLAAAVLAGVIAVITSSSNSGTKLPSGFKDCGEAHFQLPSGTPPAGATADCRVGTTPPAIKTGDLKLAANEAGCDLQENLPDEGNSHIAQGATPPAYKTNPPTSGDHALLPATDGAYSQFIQPEFFLHSLEHGRVEYHYSPNLPEDQQLAIKGLFDEDPDGLLLLPNPQMPYAVAATAWTNLVGCPKYSPAVLDVLRDFRDTYRGNGPEAQVPINF